MKIAASALLTLLLALSPLTGSKPVSIPFTLDSEGLMLVPATVGGTIPVHLIPDTGAGLDILAPNLIEKLHGTPSGQFSGFRMTGERLDIPLFVIPELSVGPMVKKNVLVGTWDVFDKLHLDGGISVNDFRQQPFTFDFTNDTMVFETAKSLVQRRAAGVSSPLQLDDQRGIVLDLFSQFLIDGQPGQCEIDTGSPGATISTRYMPVLGIDKDGKDVHKHEGHSIVGAPETRYYTTLPQLSLASAPQIRLAQPRVAFSDLIYDCVIGIDFWHGRALTIDISNRQLIVSKPPAESSVATDSAAQAHR
jgi:hypothetical protein